MDDILSGKNKKEPEFYQALGCDKSSSKEQITAEYRARVKYLHPDKLDEADSKKYEEYLRLQAAYDTLSDDLERNCYNAWLDCLLPLSYEEFRRNRDAVKVSMHWVNPKETPMISSSKAAEDEKFIKQDGNTPLRWESGRYHSDTVRRFRNYDL